MSKIEGKGLDVNPKRVVHQIVVVEVDEHGEDPDFVDTVALDVLVHVEVCHAVRN